LKAGLYVLNDSGATVNQKQKEVEQSRVVGAGLWGREDSVCAGMLLLPAPLDVDYLKRLSSDGAVGVAWITSKENRVQSDAWFEWPGI